MEAAGVCLGDVSTVRRAPLRMDRPVMEIHRRTKPLTLSEEIGVPSGVEADVLKSNRHAILLRREHEQRAGQTH